MAAPEWEDYDDISDLPPGFCFAPTDEELLGFYLRRKATGKRIPPAMDSAIPTLDLFATAAPPPWLLHPAAASSSYEDSSGIARCVVPGDTTEWFYCFTRTTPRGPGCCRTTESGTWLSTGGRKEVESRGEALGYKIALAFKVPGGVGAKGAGTNWVMHEFKIHHDKKWSNVSSSSSSSEEELVLCRIRSTKRTGGLEGATTRQKRPRTSGGANKPPGASPGSTGSRGAQLIPSCIGAVPLSASRVPFPQDNAIESADSRPLQKVGSLSQGIPAMLEEDRCEGIDSDLCEGSDLGFLRVEQDHHGDWQLVMPTE